jgi:ribosomal protein S12 methylthiotransferase
MGPYFDLIPQALDDMGGVKLTIMAISRFPKAATTPARSASFPICAESWPAGGSMPCCARRKSWLRRHPRTAGDQPGYLGLWRGRAPRNAQWKGREVRTHMTDLARELGQLRTPDGQVPWVRLHYVYPIRMWTR